MNPISENLNLGISNKSVKSPSKSATYLSSDSNLTPYVSIDFIATAALKEIIQEFEPCDTIKYCKSRNCCIIL